MHPNAYLEMANTEARHWWFVGRRAILTSVISNMTLQQSARILEIGAGTGGNLSMLSRFGSVSALETDATARSIAKAKTDGRVDIRAGLCPNDIPFPPQSFDLVCLLDVLEHIEDDVPTLMACKKLLASSGRLLLTVPAYSWLWSAHDEFLHHKRRYHVPDLRVKLAKAGLHIDRISFFNTLLFPLVALGRLKDRFLKRPLATGADVPIALINHFLSNIFGAERLLLRTCDLPFGVSLLVICSAE